ncbi:MAG TPA: biotin carboxylase N-terminal domain-containing protein [Pseudomonadales bacterium]|nr:biotin carboxylase N-terminal domain-containing protein [Pseudomonadales bacterium]
MGSKQNYLNNPLIHADRRLDQHESEWVRSFDCSDMKPLIICRGPIRKEAMDVFDEMGINNYGILLSEKDSITYTNALAPELRKLTDPSRVHRVPDYTGANKEERHQRIQQIVCIAHENGYNSIFAGYGFMSEDAEMVSAMENAGLIFIGPGSFTQSAAGLKDEAKRTALAAGVSVTPGINNGTTLALLAKYKDDAALAKCAREFKLDVKLDKLKTLEDKAEAILAASYKARVDVITVDDLGAALHKEMLKVFKENPDNRFRLKAISGGGGKGQRILNAPSSYKGSKEEQIKQAAAITPALVREVLAEVKCNGVGDNKNVLIEMNIETTRHQEIQVVGNGSWCITMGGRDCSLQMHEQKLLEVSVIREDLGNAHAEAKSAGRKAEAAQLERDIEILDKMEAEAVRFGEAVKLNSVATFECIVDGARHYFMEMNTRIQVEHRVTELCYALTFTNPDDSADSFTVTSLVNVMVLLARHGKRLPKPTRSVRELSSVEARLNATNDALQPHAGGVITKWSDPVDGEIRDDQGISMHNPDTDVFMKYTLAGAYDSNIALLLTVGNDRMQTYQRMSDVLRRTVLRGKDLATNLDFHYGLVNWFVGNNINARPTTRFIVPYLTLVGMLKEQANQVDLPHAWQAVRKSAIAAAGADKDMQKAVAAVVDRKITLFDRLFDTLLGNPHILSGWLSLHKPHFKVNKGKVSWLENPVKILADTYHFLNMEAQGKAPAAYVIWDHDNEVLQDATHFYLALDKKLGAPSWDELQKLLAGNEAPKGIAKKEWPAVQSAHAGFQAGCEILAVLPYLAEKCGFYSLKVNADLSIDIPEKLHDKELQDRMAKVLVPPPSAKSDEILALSGGMFYPREAPGHDKYLDVGTHFNKGDVMYIVEVMKMFNKVYAPFSGTVNAVLVENDGTIIKKGQPLFKITPDEVVIIESPAQISARQKKYTDEFISKNL